MSREQAKMASRIVLFRRAEKPGSIAAGPSIFNEWVLIVACVLLHVSSAVSRCIDSIELINLANKLVVKVLAAVSIVV